jgi:filamentous hemagglutinin
MFSAPSLQVPNGSLYRLNTSTSASYLVETDARFANYREWLGSDYLLAQIQLDPSVTHKRLGDGFYEQRLVREQIAQLTGNRFLGDYRDDDEQYRALMNESVTYAHAYHLRAGIALSAAQMAALTSDIVWLVEKEVTLADGSTVRALVPQVYVRVKEGDIDASGALLAGRQVNINLTGELTNTGTIAGRSVVSLTAENVNLGGRISGDAVAARARQDLNNIGGSISANSELLATAGRDLNSITTTATGRIAYGNHNTASATVVNRVAGLYVSGGNGTLLASAGRDINTVAGVISNSGPGGDTILIARNDINLATVTTSGARALNFQPKNAETRSQSQDIGSSITANGNILIKADNDINATAAQMQSSQGQVVLDAQRDVNILAGRSSQSAAATYFSQRDSFMSSSSDEQRQSSASTAIGSDIGGKTVRIHAGRDLTVKGSNVLSDEGTALIAKRDIGILADQNTTTSRSFREVKGSGFSTDGGIAYGNSRQTNTQRGTSTTAVASNVGTLGGDLTVVAGGTYSQTGSNLMTPAGDITVIAKDIRITEARNTSEGLSEQSTSKSGLSLGVSSPLISAVQGINAQADAANNTSSARMKKIAAANMVMQANQALEAAADPTVTISLSIGSSSSSASQRNQTNTAAGSSVSAGGNANLLAIGGGQDSNLLIQGSAVTAGQQLDGQALARQDASGNRLPAGQVNLQADNSITLQAARNTEVQASTSTSSSASVGIGYTAGPGGAGFGVTVSASGSRGKSDGTDLAYTNSTIDGTQVNITSAQIRSKLRSRVTLSSSPCKTAQATPARTTASAARRPSVPAATSAPAPARAASTATSKASASSPASAPAMAALMSTSRAPPRLPAASSAARKRP